jgi:hypothetical protein
MIIPLIYYFGHSWGFLSHFVACAILGLWRDVDFLRSLLVSPCSPRSGTGTIATLYLVYDVLRLKVPSVALIASRYFGFMMREKEKDRLTGVTFYLFGLLLVC